jgi:hypothetical protein
MSFYCCTPLFDVHYCRLMLMCSNRTCIFMQCILYHPSYQRNGEPVVYEITKKTFDTATHTRKTVLYASGDGKDSVLVVRVTRSSRLRLRDNNWTGLDRLTSYLAPPTMSAESCGLRWM